MKLQTKITLIFLACLTYACLRYHVFGNIAFDDFPMFIMNKVWASTALILLCLSILSSIKSTKKTAGLLCFLSSIIHIVLSICLLEPNYYDKFFVQNQLTFQAQLCLSFGLYCFICFIPSLFIDNNLNQNIQNQTKFRKLCKVSTFASILFLLIHTSIAFYPGWFKFQLWPANLPPISLICFCGLVIVSMKKLLHKNNL